MRRKSFLIVIMFFSAAVAYLFADSFSDETCLGILTALLLSVLVKE